MQGARKTDVEVKGLVPGEHPSGYADLLREAMDRAWSTHGRWPTYR